MQDHRIEAAWAFAADPASLGGSTITGRRRETRRVGLPLPWPADEQPGTSPPGEPGLVTRFLEPCGRVRAVKAARPAQTPLRHPGRCQAQHGRQGRRGHGHGQDERPFQPENALDAAIKGIQGQRRMHDRALQAPGDRPVMTCRQGPVTEEKDLAGEGPDAAEHGEHQGVQAKQRPGADDGWLADDARSGLAVAVELIVMTAKSHGAAYR